MGPKKHSHRAGIWGDNFSSIVGGNGEEVSETASLRFNLSMSAMSDKRHFITSLSQHRRMQSAVVYSTLTSPKFAPTANFFSTNQKIEINEFSLVKDENLETEEMLSECDRHQDYNSLAAKPAMSINGRTKSFSACNNVQRAHSSTTGTNYLS